MAHAQGYYTGPNLTGSQGTSQGSSPSPYQTLNLQSGPLYGTNVNGTNPACGGQIEAQWIWTAGSPPSQVPKQVIVKQFSDASWESTTASGQCADGLTNPTDPTTSTTNQSGDTTADTSGTHYSVFPADANGNLEVYCTPTASVAKGSSGVYYMASASPVFISLGGATPDSSGNYNILVGQGCTASLSGIPAALLNNTANPPTYQWSVSDSGAAFQRWNVTYVAGKSSTAALVSGPGPLTNSTAHWYWSDKAGTQTVTCTATLTPPKGQGAPFPITVTQTVNLTIPVISVTPTPGRVQINDLAQSVYGPGYYLYDGPGNGSQAGITWTATIATPGLFTQNSTQNGTLWNFVQITTPSRYRAITGGSKQPSALNGQYGLDTTYPYEPGPYSATFPGGYPASTVPSKSSDSPAVFISDTFQNYQVLDSFQTYVMYSPPGTDTQWVPVWVIEWYWAANDTMPGSWASWNNATDAGIVRATNSESVTAHPTWSSLVLAPPAGVF